MTEGDLRGTKHAKRRIERAWRCRVVRRTQYYGTYMVALCMALGVELSPDDSTAAAWESLHHVVCLVVRRCCFCLLAQCYRASPAYSMSHCRHEM